MSTKIGSAYIAVDADTKGFEKGTKGFVSRTLKVLGPLVAAFAAVFSVKALVNFTKGLRTAGERAATDAARIQQVAESMGLVAAGSTHLTDRLVGVSQEFSKLTGIEAGVVREAQAMLLTFKNVADTSGTVGGVFDRATRAAADLAAAGFGELTGNATSLGIALNDPIAGLGRLTRVGVTFTDAQKEQIAALVESGDMLAAQGLLLEAIESQVGGVAEATANTSDKVKAAWAGVMERLGGQVLPLFDRFGNFLIDTVYPKVESFVGLVLTGVSKVVDAFGDAESIPEGILNAFGVLTGGAGIGKIFEKLTGVVQKAFAGIVDWLASGGIGMILQAIIDARQRLFDAALRLFPALIDALLTVIPALVTAISTQVIPQVIAFIVSGVPLLLQAAVTLFKQLVTAAVTILPELISVLLGEVLPALLETVLDMIPDLLETAVELFTTLLEAVVTILPELITLLVGTVLPNLITTIIRMAPRLLGAAITAFVALVTALVRVLPQLITTLTTKVLPTLLTTLTKMAPQLLVTAIQLFLQLVVALVKAIPPLVKAIVVDVIPAIVRAFLRLGPQLFSAGAAAIRQLWDGIKSVAAKVVKWVQDNVVQRIKNLWPFSPAREGPFAGAGSPLRAGENIMDLLAEGLRKATPAVVGAAEAATRQLRDAVTGVSTPRLAAAGAGGTVVHLGGIEVNMHFDGDITPFRAREAGSAAADALIERLSREVLVT